MKTCRKSGLTALRLLAATAAFAIAGVFVQPPPASADSVRNAEWFLSYLRIADAHRLTEGGGVTVALLDSGVDARHPDLAGSVLAGKNFYPEYREDPTVSSDADPAGHGTGMAGLIAGHGHGQDRAAGILGVAPGAKLLPLRVRRSAEFDGGKHRSDLPGAIAWAAAQHVGVMNMSLGSREFSSEEQFAVTRASQADVVMVGAVGNRPRDSGVLYPAGYPGVLVVGGLNRSGKHSVSTLSAPELMIVAPSEETTTTIPGGTYTTRDGGSSSATAIVSGAVALVRARFPQLNAQQVIHRITATADDKGAPGRDPEYGFGVLNVVKALTATIPGEPPATAEPPPAVGREPSRTGGWLLGGGLVLLLVAGGGVWWAVRRRT